MLSVRRQSVVALLLVLVAVLPARRAHAADEVARLISVLEKKPSGVTSDQWREQRRDAARQLGQLGDKRAVPPLIKIVETEKFDAVAEIAIEALGKLGDKRAVGPLQKVWEDNSRDRYTRDAAADALRALGADPEAEATPPPEEPLKETPPKETTPKETPVDGGSLGLPAEEEDDEDLTGPIEVPAVSRFDADVLAAVERLTFAVGSLALSYDTVAEHPTLSGAASSTYRRGVEKNGFGYTFDGALAVLGGANDRDGTMADTSSFALVVSASGAVETRFYFMEPGGLFAHVDGGLALGTSALFVESPGGDLKDFTPSTDLVLGLGLGYGRTIDIGAKLRLRRLEQVLRKARLLGRPVSPDVAGRIFTAWWNLRGELGSLARLRQTLQIMREAGVLLTDPDPATVYRLIRVLEDGQLDERRDGWDARLGVGETVSGRDNVGMNDNFEWDRVETLFARATWARQLTANDSELVGNARAVYRLTGDPGFYFAQADLTFRRYLYGSGWDPRGALEFGALLGASDLDTSDDLGPGTTIGGLVGYTLFPNRASRLRVAGDLTVADKEIFVGVRIDGTFGYLANTMSAW